ncbi:MAG: glycosyltransferase family 2 protein [Vulcanimicrobiaceae bacterium]
MNLWVVIAAFNEAKVIGETLRGLIALQYQIVVVDDGSQDSTSDEARAKGVTVLRHVLNLGQGAALQTGIDFAIGAGATHICTFDADGQHAPAAIATLLDTLQSSESDIALGSRFLQPSPMPKTRRLLLILARIFTRAQTKLELTDVHNGLRLFTHEAAASLRMNQPRMAHASEILASIARHRLKYIEVPTTVSYTAYSLNKGQTFLSSFRILFDLLYAAWSR